MIIFLEETREVVKKQIPISQHPVRTWHAEMFFAFFAFLAVLRTIFIKITPVHSLLFISGVVR